MQSNVAKLQEHANTAEVHKAQWPMPDMSVLQENRRSAPALPLQVFGPTLSAWIADAAEGAGAPVDYVAAPLLGAAAALIGNARAASPWDGWADEPCVLWLGQIGKPSSGKSPGSDPTRHALSAVEAKMAEGFDAVHRDWQTKVEAAKARRDRWQADVEEAVKKGCPPPLMPVDAEEPEEPRSPRVIVHDASIEALTTLLAGNPRGLLHWRDELSGMIGAFDRYGGNGADRAFWIEAFGARSYSVDRVKHGHKPLRIPRLAISVVGTIQPDKLASVLFKGDDDGLASRFLWVWPEELPPRRPTKSADLRLLQDAFDRLAGLKPDLLDGIERPVILRLDDAAADAFETWRQHHYRADVAGLLASSFGKMYGLCLRIALVLEHLWWAVDGGEQPSGISLRAIDASAALMDDYLKPMARRVYGDAALPQVDRDASAIAKHIRANNLTAINARKITHEARLPGLRESERVRAALKHLGEAGWVRFVGGRAGGGPGRPREDYDVNPEALTP
jgi:hypothetical protein